MDKPNFILNFQYFIYGNLHKGERIRYALYLGAYAQVFLDGISLVDAYLRIYNEAGQLIAMDDDSGGNFDSLIQRGFTNSLYYVEVGSHADWHAGSYQLNILSCEIPQRPPNVSVVTCELANSIATNNGLKASITSGGVTCDNTVGLSGTIEDGAVIAIFDGDTLIAKYSQNNSMPHICENVWSFTTPALPDGPHTLTAEFTAAAGKVKSQSVFVTVDTQISGSISSVIATDSGRTSTIGIGSITKDHTLGLSGTAEPGSTVVIYDGTSLLGNALLNGVAWIFNTPRLSAGPHQLSAQIFDTAGNRFVSDSLSVRVSDGNFINIQETVNGSLVRGQRIRYDFYLDATENVRIFLDGVGPMDAYLRIFDNSNRMVAYNDDSGGSLDSLIQNSLTPGHYTIEVASWADYYPGRYNLSLTASPIL